MESELIYSFVGILVFIIIIIITFRSDVSKVVQSKEEKREDIVNGYKKQLQVALISLENDKQARIAKKSELLKKFSDELSLNIFFDKSEIRAIILELSKES